MGRGVPSVECHRGVTGVLGQVQVGGPPQLLLYHQSLLEQLEAARQKLVLHLQKVSCNRRDKLTNSLKANQSDFLLSQYVIKLSLHSVCAYFQTRVIFSYRVVTIERR